VRGHFQLAFGRAQVPPSLPLPALRPCCKRVGSWGLWAHGDSGHHTSQHLPFLCIDSSVCNSQCVTFLECVCGGMVSGPLGAVSAWTPYCAALLQLPCASPACVLVPL
jgi:hypothetical protein